MSKIDDALNKIMTSRYGKDVRQSIHDGIEQCYVDSHSVEVSKTQPNDEYSNVWIDNSNNEEEYMIPEIKDDEISKEDTWSSEKINMEFEEFNRFIENNFQTVDVSGNRYDNFYWNIESDIAVKTELDGWMAFELPVEEYQKYIVKGYPSSGEMNKFIVGTDDSYNIVSYISELTGEETNYSEISVGFIVPEGVTRILVSSKKTIVIRKIILNNYKGNLQTLNITDLSECSKYGLGFFVAYQNYVENIINLPKDFDKKVGLWLFISKVGPDGSIFYKLYQSVGKCWVSPNPNNGWESIHSYHGTFEDIDIRDLNTIFDSGTYHIGASILSEVTGLPSEVRNASVLEVISKTGTEACCQFLTEHSTNKQYIRWIVGGIPQEWSCVDDKIKKIEDKVNANPYSDLTIAIIGDSISTNGNEGTDSNVPEIEIMKEDVGIELSAYLTYYDVQNNLSLGGHIFTEDEIGTEVRFTPSSEDIGKVIGTPNNYNQNTVTTWWEVMKNELGFKKVIPVCWSGSSITSHEENDETKKCSHAWHDSQIRKCGTRIPGSINRNAPDVILIYRGTNDFSHEPYTVLTDKYFDALDFQYPNTDEVDGKYGLKEGYVLTIKKLRETYPNAKIFLCTLNIFKRINYNHYPTNNGINTLPQYNKTIREIADFMGCDTIDFDKDGITFENCYSEGYITDSETIPTHPSNKGHLVMGKKAIEDFKTKWSSMR